MTYRVGQIDEAGDRKWPVQGVVVRVDDENVDGAGVSCRECPADDIRGVRDPAERVSSRL